MIATESMKKKLVLIVLFVLPIVTYLFFTTSVANFISLPIVTTGVNDIAEFDVKEVNTPYNDTVALLLKDKVTIIGYLGDKLKTNVGIPPILTLRSLSITKVLASFK